VKRVGIVGLGFVGLPLATAFTEAGISVVGVDTDHKRIAALNSGESYIDGVSAERLQPLIAAEKLHPTKSYDALREAEATIICLPTPLNKHREPDLSIAVAGAEAIARTLRPGALVVLESTTYPGTTREVLLPIFERGGRRVGKDFYLAYSPERVDPGNLTHTIENTPRVVGGVTAECAQRAEDLYGKITAEVHRVSDPETAELAKLLENVFRGVNIALINELAILCNRMHVDVWEVIEAAKTKPFGFMPFYPGPGMGGHCIPIDPFYLSWRARAFDVSTDFIELAGRVNVNMPYYAFSRITAALNSHKKPLNGSRVLLLGMSYKPNVGDLRESPSLKILELLTGSGAKVAYHDPHVPWLADYKLYSVDLNEERLSRFDCVVIATDHDEVDLRLVVDFASKVVDLRNAVRRRLGKLHANVEVL
jgi:UDP-N-acetyl-D-glucosamine dehydrogenase